MTKRAKSPKLDRRALFALLRYEPHAGQLAVHLSRARRRVLACGSRWGKSTCGAHEAVAALLTPCRESRGWLVAPTYDLTDRIFEMVHSVLHRRMKHRVVSVVPREHKIVVCNLGGGTSELRAKSADRPASLLGEGLDWVIVDEASRLKREVWEGHLSQRLIDSNGWALLLSTPRGVGWFYKEYKRGQGRDVEYESWPQPSWINPHIDRAVVEAERLRLPSDLFRQEYGAEFVGSEHEPCELCGNPDEFALGIVMYEKGEQVPVCDECGEPIDPETGRTLVERNAGGGGTLLRIVLAPRPDATLPILEEAAS